MDYITTIMTAPSHIKSMLPLAKALRKDGHDVSVVQYYADKSEIMFDHDIDFIHVYTYSATPVNQKMEDLIWRQKMANPWELVQTGSAVGAGCHRSRLDGRNADFYRKVAAFNWDLLIVDNVYQPCGIVLSTITKNQAWIDYATTPMFKWTRRFRAVSLPLSVDITANAETYELKRFGDRLMRLLDGMEELTFWFLLSIALEKEAEGIQFGKWLVGDFHTNAVYSIGSLPAMLDIALPQAVNTFMIEYACPKASKLSNDYLQFIEDNSSKGTIVFSFGHFGNWRIAPAEVIQAFSSAFEDLPQYRIIWQFNGDLNMVANKSHVKTETWVPLAPIMQHPKTVLFITHSGIKSFREAVCFGVPVIGVPLFVDQLRHAVLSLIHGFGVRLDKTKLSKQTVHNAITTVVENSKYKQRITKFGAMVSDAIIDDTAKGKFWINFHLRHPNSVSHMRLKGVTLSCFSFNCYDVLTLLCVLFFASHYGIDC
ncbi:UDP-glucoronosyl and UDP-glucosyl transferase [Trichuris suis]|nr:UDP-glucoronosyl and UDP-glucosyl transferase [Trichuris suis]